MLCNGLSIRFRPRMGGFSKHKKITLFLCSQGRGQDAPWPYQSIPWRRERDSNPRYGCPYNTLAGCRFRPLSHLSVFISHWAHTAAHSFPEPSHSNNRQRWRKGWDSFGHPCPPPCGPHFVRSNQLSCRFVEPSVGSHPPHPETVSSPPTILYGGRGGIRTHERFPFAGFQDRCFRPLSHPSGGCARYRLSLRPVNHRHRAVAPREFAPYHLPANRFPAVRQYSGQ